MAKQYKSLSDFPLRTQKRVKREIEAGNIDNLTYFLRTKRSPNWFNRTFRKKYGGNKK